MQIVVTDNPFNSSYKYIIIILDNPFKQNREKGLYWLKTPLSLLIFQLLLDCLVVYVCFEVMSTFNLDRFRFDKKKKGDHGASEDEGSSRASTPLSELDDKAGKMFMLNCS